MCSECSWKDFVKQAKDLLIDIEDLPEQCNAKDSWADKVESLKDWAEEHEHVTERMETAVENIHKGVQRWLER